MWFVILGILLLLLIPSILLRRHRVMRFWLTLLGAWMTTGAFFLLPWVAFSPWRYGRSLTLNVAAEAVLVLMEQAEMLGLPMFLELITRVTSLPGWLVVVAMPSLNIVVRLALVGVALAGILSIVLIAIGGLARHLKARKYLGLSQSLIALLALVLLVGNLNTLDNWGAVGNFPFNLIPVIVGSEISWGAWVAVVGLVVLIVGGLWTIADAEMTTTRPEGVQDYGPNLPY